MEEVLLPISRRFGARLVEMPTQQAVKKYQLAAQQLGEEIHTVLAADADLLFDENALELAADLGAVALCHFPFFAIPETAPLPAAVYCREDLLQLLRECTMPVAQYGSACLAAPRVWLTRGQVDNLLGESGALDHRIMQQLAERAVPVVQIDSHDALLLKQPLVTRSAGAAGICLPAHLSQPNAGPSPTTEMEITSQSTPKMIPSGGQSPSNEHSNKAKMVHREDRGIGARDLP